jgi:hypothetical protein
MGKSGNKVKRRDCARLCPTIEKQFGKKSGLYLVNWRNIISGVCLLLLFKFEHSLFKKKNSTNNATTTDLFRLANLLDEKSQLKDKSLTPAHTH